MEVEGDPGLGGCTVCAGPYAPAPLLDCQEERDEDWYTELMTPC